MSDAIPETSVTFGKGQWKPFLSVAVAWWLISAALCWKAPSPTLGWMTGFFLLSVFDLYAWVRLFQEVFLVMNRSENDGSQPDIGAAQKRIFSVFRASYWGTIKLACLLFFGVGLAKGGSVGDGIPTLGLLTGMGTLVVVPLAGGLIWHFRFNRQDSPSDI